MRRRAILINTMELRSAILNMPKPCISHRKQLDNDAANNASRIAAECENMSY